MSNALDFFPSLYPGEHVFSAVSRFHILSGNRSPEDTRAQLSISAGTLKSQDIFNRPFYSAVLSVSDAARVSRNKILAEHSLYPLFFTFLSNDIKVRVDSALDVSGSIGDVVQPMNDRLLKFDKSWRLCPECIQDDIKTVGIPYWHTVHQLPTLNRCPLHRCELVGICSLCSGGFPTLNAMVMPQMVCSCQRDFKKQELSAWELWLVDRFNVVVAGDSLHKFDSILEDIKLYKQLNSLDWDELLLQLESSVGVSFLSTIFEFYAVGSDAYRGKKRPNFIRTTLMDSSGKARHPIYFLTMEWFIEMLAR